MKIILFHILMSVILTSMVSCADLINLDLEDQSSYIIPKVYSGPDKTRGNNYARGIVDAAADTLGFFAENTPSSSSLNSAKKIVSGTGYMGMVREDTILYAQLRFMTQYKQDLENGTFTQEKTLLRIASQLKPIIALYEDNVYLLVNTNNVQDTHNKETFSANPDGKLTMIDLVRNAVARKINLGIENSDSYLTGYMIVMYSLNHPGVALSDRFNVSPELFTVSAAESIEKVISGEYDAAIYVTEEERDLLKKIPSGSPVKLIPARLPGKTNIYSEKGTIQSKEFPFQNVDITENITVKTLLAAGPGFYDSDIGSFIEYLYQNSSNYSAFSSRWNELNPAKSEEYFIKHPQTANYRALSHVFGFTGSEKPDKYFYAGSPVGNYHDKAVELIWLMSHNLDIDLKEHHSTGSNENAIRILDGSASMALVQDDAFNCLVSRKTAYESMKAAAMKKVMPLDPLYVHLLVNSAASIQGIANFPGKKINLGEKTSGTFLTAMDMIESYGFGPDENITYSFESPDTAIARVNSGVYDATFLVAPFPYLPPAQFSKAIYPYIFFRNPKFAEQFTFMGTTDYIYWWVWSSWVKVPYSVDRLPLNYYDEDYGFGKSILPNKTRTVIVQSPIVSNINISKFIKAVYRKASYLGDPVFNPESYRAWKDITKEQGKDYFVKSPFGWNDEAAEYYLSLFPEEE